MDAFVTDNLAKLARQLKEAGPYLLLELLLPGGTLFALLLFLYRNPPVGIADLPVRLASPPIVQALATSQRTALPDVLLAGCAG